MPLTSTQRYRSRERHWQNSLILSIKRSKREAAFRGLKREIMKKAILLKEKEETTLTNKRGREEPGIKKTMLITLMLQPMIVRSTS